jgi:hypothetical protein
MPADKLPLVLVLADDSEHVVDVDQRDHAAAEAMDLGAETARRVTRIRYLGWSAAKRAGVTKLPWEKFNATECVAVDVAPGYTPPGDDGPSADGLDPGRPGQSDAG